MLCTCHRVVAETVQVEGQDKPGLLLTRMALKNMLVVVNKLPADLRFWVEVDRLELHSHSLSCLSPRLNAL